MDIKNGRKTLWIVKSKKYSKIQTANKVLLKTLLLKTVNQMLVLGIFVSSLHSYIARDVPVSSWGRLLIFKVVVKNWIICVWASTTEMLGKLLAIFLFVIFPLPREDRGGPLRGDWKSDKRKRPTDAQIAKPEPAKSWKCNTEIPKSAKSARDVAGLGGHLSCTKRKQKGTEGSFS